MSRIFNLQLFNDGTLLGGDNAGGETGGEQQAPPQTEGQQTPPDGGNAPPDGQQTTEQPPQGAPEQYAEFTMAEGFTMDDAAATDFKAFAKEMNLPQDQAQKVLDKYIAHQQQQIAAWQEAQAAQVADWAEQVKKDAEIGGAKFQENIAVAKKALDQFGTPELRELLESTGYGNHPEIVRLFHNIGASIVEDKFVGGSGSADTSDPGKLFFPNSK